MEIKEKIDDIRNWTLLDAEDYRQGMLNCFNFYKENIRPLTRTRLAEKMRVHTSLITNILKERADLTADQLFLFSKALELTPLESRYLELLWDRDRTTLEDKKKELTQTMREFRDQFVSVSRQSGLSEPVISQQAVAFYWTTPLAQIIVLSLSIRRFSKDISLLLKEVSESEEEFNKIFARMLEFGIIYEEKGFYKSALGNYHLPKDSPFCPVQNKMMRLASLQHTNRLRDDKDYQLSVTFAADQKTFEKIKKEIVAAVKNAQAHVGECQRQNQVFQFNIDLFPWTGS